MTDIIFTLRKNAGKVLIIIILVLLCFISVGYIFTNSNSSEETAETFDETYIKDENGEKNFYSVTELFDDDVYHEYMNDRGELYNRLKAFRSNLIESDRLDYISVSTQMIEVLSDYYVSDKFFYLYDEDGGAMGREAMKEYGCFAVNTLMPSLKFYDEFSLKLSEGRMFNETDVSFSENAEIPVIMGAAYTDYYNLGDVFYGHYAILEDEENPEALKYRIIGFLEPKQFFYDNQSLSFDPFTACDRYIFMPPLEVAGTGKEARLSLLTQLYGIVESNKGFEETLKIFNDIINESGLGQYESSLVLYDATSGFTGDNDYDNEILEEPVLKRFSAMTHAVAGQYRIMVIIVLCCVISVIALLMSGILKERFYDFGVKMLCGASRSVAAKEIVLLTAVPILSGDIIASIVLAAIGAGGLSVLIVQGVCLSVIFITSAIGILYFRRFSIFEIIGKE